MGWITDPAAWVDDRGKVPVAQTKCPYPEWRESANHKGLKTAGGMAYGKRPEAGQTAKNEAGLVGARLQTWEVVRSTITEMLGWGHRSWEGGAEGKIFEFKVELLWSYKSSEQN